MGSPNAAKRLLLVDDDAPTRRALVAWLAAAGYAVRGAGEVAGAVALAARFAPQVLVCDWLVPGEGGARAVIHACRSANPTLRAVVVSGLAAEQVAGELGNASVHVVLCKPVAPSRLLAAIEGE